ncbi:MAG: hypothetical protein ACJAV1_000673 [Paraglaciecola sp.]|jgi:hypothetical protein
MQTALKVKRPQQGLFLITTSLETITHPKVHR